MVNRFCELQPWKVAEFHRALNRECRETPSGEDRYEDIRLWLLKLGCLCPDKKRIASDYADMHITYIGRYFKLVIALITDPSSLNGGSKARGWRQGGSAAELIRSDVPGTAAAHPGVIRREIAAY